MSIDFIAEIFFYKIYSLWCNFPLRTQKDKNKIQSNLKQMCRIILMFKITKDFYFTYMHTRSICVKERWYWCAKSDLLCKSLFLQFVGSRNRRPRWLAETSEQNLHQPILCLGHHGDNLDQILLSHHPEKLESL